MPLVDVRMLADIRSFVERMVMRNFESKSRQAKLKWPPLSEKYLRRLSPRKKSGKKILVDTGRLKGSIFVETEPAKARVVASTNLVYSAIHQFGGSIPARTYITKTGKKATLPPAKIPARPYLALIDEDIEILKKNISQRVLKNVTDMITEALKKSFNGKVQ